jgi:stage V sporulation protein R
MKYAQDTLGNLNSVWSRPVHLQTVLEETSMLISFDGEDFKQEEISEN